MPKKEIIILVVFLLCIATVYLLELRFWVNFIFNKLRKHHGTKMFRTKSWIFVHILAVIGIICFLYGYFIEPYWIEVNIIPIQTDKLKQTSFRIVQISDLHCDKKIRNEKKIVEIINRMEPDIIVFTGDAVNSPAALTLFKETMKNLKASLAKFAVYGNFETRHWSGLDYYSGTGFELLDARTVVLSKDGETLSVSGLSCEMPQDARSMFEKLSAECFNVFLYHYSDLIENAADFHLDLYLCGHTHGGQVALPFYGALITLSKFGKKYESGMYTVDKTIMYVNRGIGLEAKPAPQVRFLARPEIAVFEIGPKNGSPDINRGSR
jgi:predicted MPP superfamily phosphohydrolase